MKSTIVLIEDERNISSFISTTLEAQDYKVVTAATGRDGLNLVASICPEIVLLDLGLPDMDGIDVLRQIRAWTKTPIPVIIISARTQEKEKVLALDTGADDYITKPFGTSELMARIRTTLRHSGISVKEVPYHHDGLILDYEKHLVTLDKQEIHLTQIEFKLLSLLAKSAGKVLTYSYLMGKIWGPYADSNNQVLRVNMANIRRKIEKNPAEPQYVFTEIGIGYRMAEDTSQN